MTWFATVMHRRVSRGTPGSVMRRVCAIVHVRSCDGSTGRHEALPTIDRSKRHARQIIRRFDAPPRPARMLHMPPGNQADG
ncbi:MAG: hypothetical protein QOE52_3805 [Mycobacterium sp.]|jgi:hypothetical protein|nr:hypothetical protein [Mycobacterium sp.]MDT5344621.1 hypothetical protein [Mycobacterium sp.]MDT5353234.1 hypothetical protein [Mycobacterium sp.]MDT5366007.1 hypothetical protein [Mycobacterium sp.]